MTRGSKWSTFCLMLLLSASGLCMAAPDPVKDCPVGLVCLTEAEARAVEKKSALLQERVTILEAKKPHVFGAFWSTGVTASRTGLGGYGEAGLYAGPLSVGLEVWDYGKPDAGINVAWTRQW